MHVQRFNALLEVLKTVNPENFTMCSWREDFTCGTIGCAIGWYCMSSKAIDDNFVLTNLPIVGGTYYNPSYEVSRNKKKFNLYGYEAVATYFEIEVKHAEWLFSPDAYTFDSATLDLVTKRIQAYVFLNTPPVSMVEAEAPNLQASGFDSHHRFQPEEQDHDVGAEAHQSDKVLEPA